MQNKLFSPHILSSDIAALLLRLFFGGFMLLHHGLPKMLAWTEKADSFPDPLGVGSMASLALAVFAEVFCAALLVLGLCTRWATIPLMITMLIAAFVVHGDDPLAKKEFALLYFGAYAAIYFLGPGRYAVDERLA